MSILSINGLKQLFNKDASSSNQNVLDQMIGNKIHEIDPRRFFETLAKKDLFVIVQRVNENGSMELITLDLEAHKYAYVYTSEAAMNQVAKKMPRWSGKSAKLNGEVVLEKMAKAGVGINFNGGHNYPFLMSPVNVKQAYEMAKTQAPPVVEKVAVHAGKTFILGTPKVLPEVKLNGMTEYLRRNSHIERMAFGIMDRGIDNKTNNSLCYWIGVEPTKDDLDAKEIAKQVGTLWQDIHDSTPDFVDLDLNIQVIEASKKAKVSDLALVITKDGWKQTHIQ